VGYRTQAALFARASGHEVEVPDSHEARERLTALLHAEPVGRTVPTSREAVLREAFGLTAGGGA
jgi:hypothetical protein